MIEFIRADGNILALWYIAKFMGCFLLGPISYCFLRLVLYLMDKLVAILYVFLMIWNFCFSPKFPSEET